MHPGQKKIAVMVILQCGNQYLLLKRSKAPNRDKYAPVGGKLEPHERPADAARRETLEETGLSITDIRLCGVLSETSPVDYNWLCYIYVSEIPFVEPPACDEGVLEWIHTDALHTVPMPPTDPAIYDYVGRGVPFVIDAVFDAEQNLIAMVDELSGQDLRHFIP